jgi:putative membrane protein insertion efficiency factor
MSRVSRWLAAPVVLLVRLYQRLISPMRPATCRFYPSCSAYAVTSLERFGLVRGGWLAARRLGRCHPWTPGGVDPVPLTWAGRGDVRPEDFVPADVDDAQDGDVVTDRRHEHEHQHEHEHHRT